MSRRTHPPLDLLIVGGGPVGATLAALWLGTEAARADRVLILDSGLGSSAASWPIEATPELRVSALSRAGERILRAAGAWSALRPEVAHPYQRMRVWPELIEPLDPAALTFDAAELYEPNLGYIVQNRALQHALLDVVRQRGGRWLAVAPTAVRIDEGVVTVATAEGEFSASVLVGADGARSAVRQLLGLPVRSQDYDQLALVASVQPQHAHQDTAWQRFLGAGTLALLPLANGRCSIVWSVPRAEGARLLDLDARAFSDALTQASGRALGRLEVDGERLAFPLRRLEASHYAAERCVLVGDAAHVVHPLAGQGVNLGLLDAAALAQTLEAALREGEDPGARRVLRRYERWRKSDNELMSAAIDGFNRFLAFGRDPVGRLAQRGLGWVERSSMAKRFLVERALGLTGDLPAVAQTGFRRAG